jgi:thioesterase domain-containing protein
MQYTVPARRPILPFRLDPTADGADITDNPRRSSARTQPWKGGLEELAAVYIELLRTVVGSGPVLLGGWSFGELNILEDTNLQHADIRLGGVVAVEMSRQLVLLGELAGIVVEGLILIDTVYPEKSHDGGPSVKMFGPSMTRETKRELLRSFAASAALLDGWKPSPLPHVAHPRAVLLRASDWVSQKAIARVDVRRNAFLLGWEKYAHSFIDMVLNVAGHHYAVFDKEHLQDLGAAIRHACLVLER